MPAFVPAWKKLGLQLKNQPAESKEEAEAALTTVKNGHVTKKRKAQAISQETVEPEVVKHVEPQVKEHSKDEVQPESMAAETPQKRARIMFRDEAGDGELASSTPVSTRKAGGTPKSILKKSAGGDAKAEEHKSAEKKRDAAVKESQAMDDLEPPPPKTKAEKKAKREKRRQEEAAKNKPVTEENPAKVNSTTDSNNEDTTSRPYLDYLTQFHTTPSEWKFSKNHQTTVLNNVFNFFRIPASYDAALAAYITGLKGAAARERLGLQARSIVAEPVDPADTESNDYKRKTASRTRAEQSVEALEKGEAAPKSTAVNGKITFSDGPAPAKPRVAQPPPSKKKSRGRKRRTEVESSSSSSDSSSDDSSDSD
jgi:hypothetical protein